MAGNMDGFSININADDSRARRTFTNFFNFMNKAEGGVKRLNGSLGDLGNKYDGAFQDKSGRWRTANGRFLTMKEQSDMLGKSFKTTTGLSSSLNKTILGVAGGIAGFVAVDASIRGVIGAFTGSIKAATEWESAFAGVRKTIDMTESEYSAFADTLLNMTREMPQTSTEIAGIAEAAGQLGIKRENLEGFTETMAQLGVATNMSSQDAANALARLANITGMPQTEFDRLGATVVALGNSMATTESEIVEMSLRIAGAGKQVGLSEAQITSFSAALSSVGLTAEAGGSAISRTFLNINTAVKGGGEALEGFAEVAGMSGSEFKQAFEKDAANAMSIFLKGLDNINKTGGDTSAVLRDIGIKDTLMIDALQRAAGASDLFSQALETGNTAWDENTALVNEANERYKTYESQVQIMKNAFNELAITVGTPMKDGLAPVVGGLARGAQVINDTLQVLSGNKSLQELNKNTRGAVTAIVQYLESLKPAIDGIKAVFDIAMDVASLVGGAIAVGFQATLKAIVPLANAVGRLLSIISQIPGLVPAITGLIAAFVAMRTTAAIVGGVTTAITLFRAAMLILLNPVNRAITLVLLFQRAQMLLNAAFLANPIGIIVGAIVGLGVALVAAYKHSEAFRNIVDTLFQSIANGAAATVTFMQTAADEIINFFRQVGVDTATMFKDGFVVGLQNIGTAISTGVQNGIQTAQDQMRNVGSYISGLIGEGMRDRIASAVQPFIQQLQFGFQNIGGAISYILPLIGSIGLRMIGLTGPVGLVIGAILSLVGFFYRLYQTNETFAAGVNTVWGGIVSVFQTVIGALQPIFDIFRQAAAEFMTVLGPQFAETGQVIRQSFADLQPTFQELAAAFSELGTTLVQTWQTLIPQIMPLIQELSVSFGQLAQTVIPILLDVVKQLIGVWVQLAQSYMEIASVVLPLLLSVFMQIFPVILQVIQTVLPVVLNLISSLIPIILQIVQIVLPALLSIVRAVFPIILSIIQAVIPIVIQIIGLAATIITELAKIVIPALLAIVQAVFPIILSVIKTVIPIVVQILKLAANIITSVLIPAIEFILDVVNIVFPAIMKIIQNILNIVIGIVKLFTSVLKGDWKGAFDALLSIAKNILNAIWTVIKTVLDLIVSIFRGAWNLIKSITSTVFSGILNTIKNIFNTIVNAVKNGANNAYNYVKNAWQNAWDQTKTMFNNIKDRVKGTFDDIVGFAKDLPGRIRDGIKNAASKVMDGVKAVSNKLVEGLGLGVNGVIKGVNWVLEKVGSDKKYDEWTVPEYAKGTPAGGHTGGPMIVGDGGLPELVVMPNGRMMLSPATDTLMNAPKGTQVLSGDRTKRMMDSIRPPFYKDGSGLINRAADLYESTKNGIKKGYGKAKEVVIDIFDYVKNPGKLVTKALEAVGFNGLPDLTGAVGSIMKGGYNKVKDTAIDHVKGLLKESTTFTGKGGSAAVKKWVQQAINIAGVPASWANALETIAMKESGGNPNAFNNWDINAKNGVPSQGLMQTIPPTFNAYKYPGHNNIRNPIDNILAAIGYIKARYGNVFNVPGIKAMANGGKYVGYATGGFIDKMHMAMVGEGNKKEVVIPLEAKQRMQPFADATAAGIRENLTGVGGNGETKFEQHNVFTNIVPMTPAEARASQKKVMKQGAIEWGLK